MRRVLISMGVAALLTATSLATGGRPRMADLACGLALAAYRFERHKTADPTPAGAARRGTGHSLFSGFFIVGRKPAQTPTSRRNTPKPARGQRRKHPVAPAQPERAEQWSMNRP